MEGLNIRIKRNHHRHEKRWLNIKKSLKTELSGTMNITETEITGITKGFLSLTIYHFVVVVERLYFTVSYTVLAIYTLDRLYRIIRLFSKWYHIL